MEIEIQNAQRLIEQAGNVAQIANNILMVQEDLSTASSQISGAWASDTVDKDSYLKKLNDNLDKISTLCSACRALSNALIAYAQEQIRTANNG